MFVYVLIETGQTSPVAILYKPECTSLLPYDAQEIIPINPNQKEGHRKICGQWSSKLNGSLYTLICFHVI